MRTALGPSYKYQLHSNRIFQTPVIFPNGLMPGATTLLNDERQLNAAVLEMAPPFIFFLGPSLLSGQIDQCRASHLCLQKARLVSLVRTSTRRRWRPEYQQERSPNIAIYAV